MYNIEREVKKPTSDKFAGKVVGDPSQLQIHLNAIFPDEDELSVHNTYRAFAWLSFMGFPENEALAIKCDEVDLDAMVVKHAGEEPLTIYPEALQCMKVCKELKIFKYTHPSYKVITIDRKREGGDLLLRGFISGVEQSPHYKLNNVLSRAQTTAARTGRITKRLNYFSIWQSGIFYRAFQNEKMGIQPDFRKAAIRRWLNIPKQVANERTEVDLENDVWRRRIRNMQRTLELNYIRWINLFH